MNNTNVTYLDVDSEHMIDEESPTLPERELVVGDVIIKLEQAIREDEMLARCVTGPDRVFALAHLRILLLEIEQSILGENLYGKLTKGQFVNAAFNLIREKRKEINHPDYTVHLLLCSAVSAHLERLFFPETEDKDNE